MGHLYGKLANLIYSILKNNVKYDPVVHAAVSGINLADLNKSKEEKEPLLLSQRAKLWSREILRSKDLHFQELIE